MPDAFFEHPILNSQISQATKRRRGLCQWRRRVQQEENVLAAQVQGMRLGNSDTLQPHHSLVPQLGPKAQTLQQNLVAQVGAMMTAWDEVLRSQAARAGPLKRITALQQRKNIQEVFGLVLLLVGIGVVLLLKAFSALLLVGIGVVLLLKAFNKSEINALQEAVAREHQTEQSVRQRFIQSQQQAVQILQQLQAESAAFFARLLEENAREWQKQWKAMPPFVRGDWSAEAWGAHDFTRSYQMPVLTAALAVESLSASATPFVYPLFAPAVGQGKTLVLNGPANQTLSRMHGWILQLASALPYQCTFMLLDPAGAGRAFPMQRGLPFTRRPGVDFYRELEAVLEDITRIIHTYLDGETTSFEKLPPQIQANERFEFIFAANFPDGYDRRSIEALQKIARNGPAAGKYLIIQCSPEKSLPQDIRWEDFGSLWTYNLLQPPFTGIDGFEVAEYHGPQGSDSGHILKRLAAAKPPENKIDWKDLLDSDHSTWWCEQAGEMISAPVGSSGRERKLTIWFGANRDGRPCAHGILGAMTGSGKSNLYHVLVCGLAIRYSPDELNLYLIDGKFGVEFQPYRSLPHARVVALHSAPELSRSVLEELLAEMKRRNELFKKHGVSDLAGYRAKGAPGGRLPRTVLLVDEYQELFDDDRLGQASATLLQLAQQGRSSGIHMLLGSQRFGAAGMLHQAAIFGNIHLRMAMQMSQNDVQALTEFGRDGKRLVEQCDLPGKIVINDQSGEDRANEFGKVALIDATERADVLARIQVKAGLGLSAAERFATVVFDGQEQPNFVENPQVARLLQRPCRASAADWRHIALRLVHEQGLGVGDWYAGEAPLALWLGQELNVHGQARLILRRRAMENVLLVGEHQPAIYGMLMGLLASLPLNTDPSAFRVWIADRAVPGTPWEHALDSVSLPLLDDMGYAVTRTREARQAVAWLDEWQAELDRRLALDEVALAVVPTWLMVLAGVDRLPALIRVQNKFGAVSDTSEGEKLKRIYREGPPLGLHVILTFPAGGSLRQVLDRAQIEQFKHRIVTQMSEADSFLLLGKDHASRLQRTEARPIFALYLDTIGGAEVKFKPYTVDAHIAWDAQVQHVKNTLQTWRNE